MCAMTTWFCDAYASWQKGGVENANGRLRRWLPRQIDIDKVSDDEIQDTSSPPISRRENASVSRPHSRRSSKSLAKTCKSGFHRPVAPRSKSTLAMAESVCRTADWNAAARLPGSCSHLWRAASAAGSSRVFPIRRERTCRWTGSSARSINPATGSDHCCAGSLRAASLLFADLRGYDFQEGKVAVRGCCNGSRHSGTTCPRHGRSQWHRSRDRTCIYR